MKKTLLILISTLAFNFAQADENTPVNFHPDQRTGQFNMSVRMLMRGAVHEFDQKICFMPGGMRDNKVTGKFEDGCRGKKLKDTSTDLEYLVSCPGKGDMHMAWKRLSTNDFTFSMKSDQSEVETTYEYVGEKCDADAPRS